MRNDVFNKFKNPTNEYRGKPFWSWNGKLEKEELIRQIEVMNEMGFGGYFMHSRTGLETEYLSEEWFELINACSDKGEELGMEAWLYDEDRWPSGTAGGLVTMEPRYRSKYLVMDTIPAKSFKWDKDYIIAFETDLKENNYTYANKVDKKNFKNSNENSIIIAFYVKEMDKHSFYNGYTYLDTINKEAVEAYIISTHEKYKDKCGERFGKAIKGIFTDEPHRGGLFTNFNGGINQVPWTYDLFLEFEKRFGYSIIEKLPELYLIKNGEKVSPVKWHFVELLQQLFIERFAMPINEWCEANGIILTGHVLHEDSFTCQTAMHGSLMRFYEHMGYPGVDVLTEGNKNFWIVKQLASVARQTGKKWLLSELYGCTGWQFNFESHKNVGDWQALFGINLRCHHLSWYTMKGESKRDYPASILHQSAWYKEYKYVEDYFSRLNVILMQGKPACDLLVLNAIESVWSRVYSGCFNVLSATDDKMQELEKKYAQTFSYLAGAKIDFDYGDEEMLSRLGKVVVRKNEVILKFGDAQYKKVLITGMDTIRKSTIKLLKEFVKKGGTVIFAGEIPSYVDALKSNEAFELSKASTCVEFEKNAICDACKSGEEIVIDGNGENIYCQVRKDKDKKYIVLLNIDRENGLEDAVINLGKGKGVEEWDAKTGKISPVQYYIENEQIVVKTDIQNGAEKIFVVKDTKIVPKKPLVKTKFATLPNDYSYSLSESNVLVLDKASYRINNGKWQSTKEILSVDRAVRDEFKLPYRAGDMIQPWFEVKQNAGKKDVLGEVSLKFEFNIKNMPKKDIELVMEMPDDFEILVNGNTFEKNIDGVWIDICFKKILIPVSMLKRGKNEIILKTQFHKGINLEAIYLVGNFGVELKESKPYITKLPRRLKLGDISSQGLPFYSGKIKYKVEVKGIKSKNAVLNAEGFLGACLKVVKGNREEMIAWAPYEANISKLVTRSESFELELVLTRRNTFGPLHQKPLLSAAYGPDNFITKGDGFADEYMLIPQGLINAPVVYILE